VKSAGDAVLAFAPGSEDDQSSLDVKSPKPPTQCPSCGHEF